MRQTVFHTLSPIFNERSRVLILGTMPSPVSRESDFYYAHPQNRFWRVMFALLHEPFSLDFNIRRELCLKHGIALWDVFQSCSIEGAGDSSIKNAVPNDFSKILAVADIRAVFTTGKTAGKFYHRLCEAETKIPAVTLFSPSPANCAVSLESLIAQYQAILPYLH